MNITLIFAAGLVVAIMAVIVGGLKSEYSMLIAVCGGALLLMANLPWIEKLMETVTGAAERANVNSGYVALVIKASGISCVSSICSAICRDMGQTAIGAKLELVGRVAIMLTAIPAINALLSLIERTV